MLFFNKTIQYYYVMQNWLCIIITHIQYVRKVYLILSCSLTDYNRTWFCFVDFFFVLYLYMQFS